MTEKLLTGTLSLNENKENENERKKNKRAEWEQYWVHSYENDLYNIKERKCGRKKS